MFSARSVVVISQSSSAMYIPELDALIFLATEFSGSTVDQPTLKAGVKALHEAAGAPQVVLLQVVSSDCLVPGLSRPYIVRRHRRLQIW